MNPKPAPAAKPATSPFKMTRSMEIVGGAVLALLALAAIAAILIGRRRNRRAQEEADAQTMAMTDPFETVAPEPVIGQEEPTAAEPSAFAWGNQASTDEPPRVNEATSDDDDRRPGETWVERAYRGPSPNNPSVSLRNRLSRAAFFDKREREAAAGLAEPVDASAGLPQAMIEEQERENA